MFLPNKTKFKKQHRGKKKNRISTYFTLDKYKFGVLGIRAVESGQLTSIQLQAIYNCINKIIKKAGRVRLNIFPHNPITKKPIEVRMGKGKGNVSFWAITVKSGSLICEICCNNMALALKAAQQTQYRFSIKTKYSIKF